MELNHPGGLWSMSLLLTRLPPPPSTALTPWCRWRIRNEQKTQTKKEANFAMKLKADPDARVSVHLTDTITKSDCTGNAGISSQCGLIAQKPVT